MLVTLNGKLGGNWPAALSFAARLKDLRLTRGWHAPEQALELPAALFERTSLQSLHVEGYALGPLPADWSALQDLSHLSFSRCELAAVPAAALRLPRLETLSLNDNQLSELPDGTDLPEVQSINLAGNQLTSLPASIAGLPKLRRLNLQNNAWEALPPKVQNLELQLDLADRRRLLDYEYAGADGSGVLPWDDAVFQASGHPGLAAALEDFLTDPAVAPHAEALRSLGKRSIALSHTGPEDYGSVGNHRFGGMPDLPPSIPYPRLKRTDTAENEASSTQLSIPYEFLAQVNCAELAPLQEYLPRTGMLYFFLSTIHDIYGGSSVSPVRVLHFPGPLTELRSGKDLHIPAGDYFEMTASSYEAFAARASLAPSLPSFYAAESNPHLFQGAAAGLTEAEDFLSDQAMELLEEPLNAAYPADHAINAYAFTQHEDPEHQAALAQRGTAEDRIILLTVKSRGDFQWGDAGDRFFVIHKSDLTRGDFSNVFCTMESS